MASREDGKKVGTVAVKVEDVAYSVPVRMVQADSGAYVEIKRTTHFWAVDREQDIDLRNVSYDALRDDVVAFLKARAKPVEWRSYLHVEVTSSKALRPGTSGSRHRHRRGESVDDSDLFAHLESYWSGGSIGFELKVEVSRVSLAEVAGHKLRRSWCGNDEEDRWDRPVEGWPKEGVDEEDGAVSALVADTPDNRAALVRLRDALRQVVVRLDVLLHPDALQRTLSAIAAGQAPKLTAGDNPVTRKQARSHG